MVAHIAKRYSNSEQELEDLISIGIVGLIKANKFPEAIEVSNKRKFTPKQFGKIANMTELSAEEIYKRVLV